MVADAGHLWIVLVDVGHLGLLIRLFRVASVGLGTHVRRWCLVGWEPTGTIGRTGTIWRTCTAGTIDGGILDRFALKHCMVIDGLAV